MFVDVRFDSFYDDLGFKPLITTTTSSTTRTKNQLVEQQQQQQQQEQQQAQSAPALEEIAVNVAPVKQRAVNAGKAINTEPSATVVPDSFQGLNAFDEKWGEKAPIAPITSSELENRIQQAFDYANNDNDNEKKQEQDMPVMEEQAVKDRETVVEEFVMEEAAVEYFVEDSVEDSVEEPVVEETADGIDLETVVVTQEEPLSEEATVEKETIATVTQNAIGFAENGQPLQLNGEFTTLSWNQPVVAFAPAAPPSLPKEQTVVESIVSQKEEPSAADTTQKEESVAPVVQADKVADLEKNAAELQQQQQQQQQQQSYFQQRIAESRRRANAQTAAMAPKDLTVDETSVQASTECVVVDTSNDEMNDSHNVDKALLDPPENIMVPNNANVAASEMVSPARPANAPPRALLQRAIMGEVMRRNNGRNSNTARPMSSFSSEDAELSAWELPFFAEWAVSVDKNDN